MVIRAAGRARAGPREASSAAPMRPRIEWCRRPAARSGVSWKSRALRGAGRARLTAVIAASLQEACRDVGCPVPTREEALFVIGLNIADTFQRVVPALDEAGRARLADRYRHHFLAREHEAPLFGGVREMLSDLHGRGRRLAVATGKARRGLDRALDATGLWIRRANWPKNGALN